VRFAYVVIGVEVVDAENRVAAAQVCGGDCGADETGGAGDEEIHAALMPDLARYGFAGTVASARNRVNAWPPNATKPW